MIDIRRNQIWKSKQNDMQVIIERKKGGCYWRVKKLTERAGVYNGVHTLNEITLRKAFTLIL